MSLDPFQIGPATPHLQSVEMTPGCSKRNAIKCATTDGRRLPPRSVPRLAISRFYCRTAGRGPRGAQYPKFSVRKSRVNPPQVSLYCLTVSTDFFCLSLNNSSISCRHCTVLPSSKALRPSSIVFRVFLVRNVLVVPDVSCRELSHVFVIWVLKTFQGF